MKRILILSPSQGAYGGIEAFVIALGQYLKNCPNYQVYLCFKLVSNCAMSERLLKIVQDTNIPFQVVNRASPALLKAISKADLVHAQNASPDVALLSRLSGAKLVQTIHNHLHDRGFIRTVSWKFGASLANFRLYNSSFVKNSWEKQDSNNSQVIPTVSQLEYDFAPLVSRSGFIFVSRLIANKGADTLISAYQSANIDHNSWPLHILGDGPMAAELKLLSGEANIPVTFHGFVSDEAKRNAIRTAKWLIAPPNTREDMGLTPLEARANGIPVIATRDGGLPESAGQQALLCEPGNVGDLKQQIEIAANMPQDEYNERATLSLESLEVHLRPMSFYPELYQRLLS